MLLLSAVLSYHLASLYKHMFYFQARVEQSVSFLLLPTFSSYYGAKHETSRTGSPGDSRINVPSWVPRKHMPRLYPGTSRTNPPLSYPGCPGPRPNLDSKPPHLNPGLSAAQGPPPPPLPISRSGKSRIRDKRAASLPCAHTQVCARDNNL